jgi:hypothetical protein
MLDFGTLRGDSVTTVIPYGEGQAKKVAVPLSRCPMPTRKDEPAVLQALLDAMTDTGKIMDAATALGMSRRTVSRYKRDHPELASLMARALSGERVLLPDGYSPDDDVREPPGDEPEQPQDVPAKKPRKKRKRRAQSKPKPRTQKRYVASTYSTLIREAPESPRDHLERLARIADDQEAASDLRWRALEALNKFYLGPMLQERSVMAERVGHQVNISTRVRQLEEEAGLESQPALEEGEGDEDAAPVGPMIPLVFAAIPANGSEAPGHGPADVIDIELAPDEAS